MMKQEQYKNMYQQIQLNETQKSKIWQQLRTAEESNGKEHFSLKIITQKTRLSEGACFRTRAAVCAGLFLLSGMTVLAAGEFSVVDRITEAMEIFTQNKHLSTDGQKNLYAQYGDVLNNEIALEYGTLKLDASLHDDNHLLISFRYIYYPDIEGYEELTAGVDIYETSLWKGSEGTLKGYDQDIYTLNYCLEQSTEVNRGIGSIYTIRNEEIEENGIIKGSIMLNPGTGKTFQEGDIIQVIRETKQLDSSKKTDEILTEFALGSTLEQRTIPIDKGQAEALKQMDLSMECMMISAISYHCSGIIMNEMEVQIPFSIAVVLKDGSIVEKSANGSGERISDDGMEQGYAFSVNQFFDAPISLDEVAGIWICKGDSEVWLPME